MADGENWFLERLADAFDRERRENMRFLAGVSKANAETLADVLGIPDHWAVKGTKASDNVMHAFLDFTHSITGGFLDTLRFGETFRKPSRGAVINDGIF